ncbi:MAG TPA: hypothetical protein VL308_22665 [Gemmatimonadaceae bacterium]|nr:hypothetical protein [Gemmatimonadaceae bacterium]
MHLGSRYGLRFTVTGAVAVLSLAGAPAIASAQGIDTRCPGGSLTEQTTQDACQKAVDIFAFMTPQLGIGLVGGNATLGATSALGGIGHFSIGVRGNATRGRVPQVSDVSYSVSGAQQSDFGVQDQVVGLPAVDAAIGLFGGLPVGLSHAFALDGLVSASYVPAFNNSNMAVSLPDGSLKLGYGARLGVLTESFAIPAVSITYLKRDLPTTSISASSGDDDIVVSNIGVKTSAWRAVAGKSLGFFGIALGAGQDMYDNRATAAVRVNDAGGVVDGGPYELSQKVTRANMFADFSFNFPFIKFAAEVGRVSGGKIDTYNTFSGKRADDALTYASVGFRVAR